MVEQLLSKPPDIEFVEHYDDVWVKKGVRSGFGRADGLIISRTKEGHLVSASLEAKSSRTFWAISEGYDDRKWVTLGLLIGVTGMMQF